jgi:hypothetical protein
MRLMMMKRSLPLLLLILTTASLAAAPTPLKTAEYVAMGVPSPDHRWTVADYIAASRILVPLPPEKLPRKGSALFTRIMSTENFAPLHGTAPIDDRGGIAFALLPPLRALTQAYMRPGSVMAGLDAEAIDALEMTIAYFTEAGALTDAKANTLAPGAPPPPLRGAIAGVGALALERLTDVKGYRLSERLRLAQALTTSLPRLLAHASPDGRAVVVGEVDKMVANAKEPEIRTAAKKIAVALKP